MSYLRRWRKIRAATAAIVLQNSSSEDEANTCIHAQDNIPVDSTLDVTEQDHELNQSDNRSVSDVDIDSDFGFIVDDSSDGDSLDSDIIHGEDDKPTFQEKIAAWCTENSITRSAVNQILEILRSEGLPFPKDARTLLRTPRTINTEEKCGGTYAYFGLKTSIDKVLLQFDHSEIPTEIELLVNIDGIPLFKSSGEQFWPILCSFKESRPFLVAIFFGKSKPNSVDDLLLDFLTEYSDIKQNGFFYNNCLIRVRIKSFVCDAPARALLKCIKNHTGYYACERCTIKGTWKNNRIILDGPDCAPRTEEDFARNSYPEHQHAISPIQTAGFNCVNGFSLDYMHLVCLGVVKRILTFLKQGPKDCKLSYRQISEISTQLLLFSGKLPSEFARQPRTLFEVERWKATEFRQFLLYTGLVVFKKILHKNAYTHFLCLTIGVSILLEANAQKRTAYLNYARQLLTRFVDRSNHFYSDHFLVYNVHNLKHLCDDVEYFQCSLNEISAFQFENHLQIVKRLVRNSKNPVGQVGKRIAEFDNIRGPNTKTSLKPTSHSISTNRRNGCLLLKNEDFAFVKEKRPDGYLVCDVIRQRNLENFFTQPCDSKLINIAFMKQSTQHQRRLIDPEEIERKVVCLPCDGGYVLLPLLHGVEKNKW